MCTHRNSPYHNTLVHPCYQLSTSNNHSLPVEVPGVFLHTIYIHPRVKKVVQIKNVTILEKQTNERAIHIRMLYVRSNRQIEAKFLQKQESSMMIPLYHFSFYFSRGSLPQNNLIFIPNLVHNVPYSQARTKHNK